jgi:hypothetical protein
LYEATLIDISMCGVLVELKGSVDIEVGDQARLRVLNGNGNQAFELDTLVVHRSEQGIGLAVNAIDRHAQSGVQRLIGSGPGAPALAARTLPALLEANFRANPVQAACA